MQEDCRSMILVNYRGRINIEKKSKIQQKLENPTKIDDRRHVFGECDLKRILAGFWDGSGRPKP